MVDTNKICEIVAGALKVDADKIQPETVSSDVAEWDSLGHLTILMALKEKLGNEYKESAELASSVSIKEICDALAA